MAKVNKVHEGVYTCRAENVYGVAEATAFLKVLGKYNSHHLFQGPVPSRQHYLKIQKNKMISFTSVSHFI